MKVELSGEERAAIALASAAVNRVFDFCSTMLKAPNVCPENAMELADIHATAACAAGDLTELVKMIDSQKGDSE